MSQRAKTEGCMAQSTLALQIPFPPQVFSASLPSFSLLYAKQNFSTSHHVWTSNHRVYSFMISLNHNNIWYNLLKTTSWSIFPNPFSLYYFYLWVFFWSLSFILILFVVVLGIKQRVLRKLGKCFTPELYLQPCFCYFCYETIDTFMVQVKFKSTGHTIF